MARTRKEISPEALKALLNRADHITDELMDACAMIDNHIPEVELRDIHLSTMIRLAIEANNMALRIRTIQRTYAMENQT